MSENIERLKTAIRDSDALDHESGCPICDALRAALAAVEQEMAALRLSYENASRAHFEATKRIDALTECQAKLKAELDEEVDHNARLSAKLDETKHNCACDYDERGAVCLVHTRPVREARERIAALQAERDELRKRPTLEEIGTAVNAATNGDYLSYTNEYQRARSVVLEAVAALYAEKAASPEADPATAAGEG